MTADTADTLQIERIVDELTSQLSASRKQITQALDLLEAGNTLPFIARYRKEATGGLDETALRQIEDALHLEHELSARKKTVLRSLESQELLTNKLRDAVLACKERAQLEELYLPFKPQRRTRASVAIEQGLEPLAELLLKQEAPTGSKSQMLQPFVNPDNNVPDTATAIKGACDIIAARWATNADCRKLLLEAVRHGQLKSKVKRGKKEEGSQFENLFDATTSMRRMTSHRFLAMKRGESAGILKLSAQVDEDYILRELGRQLLVNPQCAFRAELKDTVQDCFARLLFPQAESTVMQELKVRADAEAIEVFAGNLRDLLLTPPAGQRVTIGIDPGFRTGCKVAVVDETGRFLEHCTIFPTPPRNDTAKAGETLKQLIVSHGASLIAIGNGTASRETDRFVTDLIQSEDLQVTKAIVSESGASIYSASEFAAAEYPDLDVTVRGAISIAHRLQDPLSELVKLDPRSIGVGQYQHDVNQKELRRSLDREVLSCVNSVGVELNQASAALLSYVSGIGPTLAARIVEFREAQGRFETRKQLREVSGLGAKAFEQAAGFLRIADATNALDRSAVHPESYAIVEGMADSLGVSPDDLVGSQAHVSRLNAGDFVTKNAGLPTVKDILDELTRPGRDPRGEFKSARFRDDVNSPEDLQVGMVLEGTVTNVTNFGAFVDVGVHQDGLVHISELANEFVSDPRQFVTVGDVLKVKVIQVDLDRKRIALSRKQMLQ